MQAPTRKFLFGAALVALFSTHFLYGRALYFLCDDAYITFRYARNFALGRGLVWNPGEYVEGYTNFLWTLILAGGLRAGVSPEWLAPLLSVLATVATLALLVPFARRLAPGRADGLALVAIALLAVNRSWNVWATGGLETRLFTLLFCAGVYCLLLAPRAYRVPGSLLLGLAALTRPDALLLAAMTFLALAFEQRRDLFVRDPRKIAATLRSWLVAGLPFVLITGAHLLFRLYYYERPLPNTYYAKVDVPWPQMGALFVRAFVLEYGLVFWLTIGTLLLIFAKKNHEPTRFYVYFLAILLPHLLYYAYSVGGDHFEYRIFDPYLPFLALFMGHALLNLFSGARAPTNARAVLAGAGRVFLAGWLLVLYVFIPNWPWFLKSGTVFGNSGVPVEEPEKIARPYFFVPLLRTSFSYWKDAQLKLQHHQVAIRMEAHREFWRWRTKQMRPFFGRSLPPDAVTEDGGIGILGYFVDIPVIDRLGLTDRVVAEQGTVLHANPEERMIAHNRQPPPGYMRSRGFTLYVHCFVEGLVSDPVAIERQCPEGYRTMSPQGVTYVARWNDFYFVFSAPPPFARSTTEWTQRTFREYRPVQVPPRP